MNITDPEYAILTTKVQRAADLHALDLHNNRLIPVVGADPSVKDGVKVLRLDSINALAAVGVRIDLAGAKRPHEDRVWACEMILTFSPQAKNFPPLPVFEKRSVAYLDATFGRANVVAIWLHIDESTPHLHALVVPICEGLRPGRPKDDEDDLPFRTVVSWTEFSGSNLRNYRDPKKEKLAKKKKRRERLAKEKTMKNIRMSSWQSAWAEVWADYGFRRGIPSQRGQLPMKTIHARQAAIAGRADDAFTRVASSVKGLRLSDTDLEKLRKNPTTATFVELALVYILPLVAGCLETLRIMADKAIQLSSEKRARADIADAYAALKKDYESLLALHPASQPGAEDLAAENKLLNEEIERIKKLVENPDVQLLEEQLARLPKAELIRITEAAKARRGQAIDSKASHHGHHHKPLPELKKKEGLDQQELPGI